MFKIKINKTVLYVILAVIAFVLLVSLVFYSVTKKELPSINVSGEPKITKPEEVSKKNATIIERILDIFSKEKNETTEIREEKENISEPKNITTTIVGPGVEVSEERVKSGKEVFVSVDVVEAFEQSEFVEVEINTKETLSYDQIIEKIFKGVNESEYTINSHFSTSIEATISKKTFEKIKNNKHIFVIIKKVETKKTLLDTSKLINFDIINNLGYNGSGIGVCIIDSGVDSDHLYLKGRVIAEKCFCTKSDYGGGGCCPPNGTAEGNNASDDDGHGTHVAGIIASTHNTYQGVSKGVGIVAVKVMDQNGTTTVLDEAKAIQWCVDNKDLFNIKIISISIARESPAFTSPVFCDPLLVGRNVTNAYNNGLFVVAGSGNSGFTDIIGEPACASKAASVGATTKQDNIWPFTTRNQYLNFYAPGGTQGLAGNPPVYTDIVSLYSTRVKNDPNLCVRWVNDSGIWTCQDDDYDVDGYFIRLQGTSMATPHVSGSAALLQQFYYQKTGFYLTPEQIKDTLNITGVPIWDSAINKSISRIDIATAIASLTTYQVGATINGKVRQGQTWRVNLSVSNLTNKRLNVDLKWNSSDFLDLTLISPSGQQYTNKLNENHPQHTDVDNPTSGVWTIKVKGTNVNGFADFSVKTSQEPLSQPPAGINFTFTKLNYISACNNSNEGLTVVLKGESNSSKPIVDVSNKTNMTSKSFLAGLIIPNHKMLVNLPLGKVDIDPFLAKTEAGRVMLDADVKLKFSAFNTQASIDEYKSIIQQLYSLYEQSPYVSEIKNSGYDGYPQWEAATWISPNSIKAEGENCKIFLTNTTLKVESKLKWSYSNIDGFNVRQEAKDDINSRFNSWKGNLTQWLNNNAQRAQAEVNSDSKYDDLRYVYASVALAQWYKTLDRSQVLFGDIIDSNEIYSYDLNISFDKAFWEQQANQRITENINLNSCFKQGWTSCYAWIYGGVVYINLNTNITSALNNDTKQVISDAVNTVYGQKSTENQSFYYANFIEVKKPELEPLDLWFSSLKPYTEKKINISVAIENKGNADAKNFTINFYYNYTNVNGTSAIYPIGIVDNQNVSSGGVIVVKKEWNSGQLGKYNIFAEADYNNNVSERNELNNLIMKSIERITPYPSVTITSPANNVQAIYRQSLTFTGVATDLQDGTLSGSSFNWSSNIDGYLGSGTTLTANLSAGAQIVTLTVTDSEGYQAKDSVSLGILSSNPPSATVTSPVSRSFAEGEIIYFEGSGEDIEDGTNLAYSWNSSLDSLLSTSKTFSTKNLTMGIHAMSFGVTDSTSLTTYYTFNLTINEGTPVVIIINPQNNQEISYKAITNFSANTTDPQDENISSAITWTSSINGKIGSGGSFSYNLSIGTHDISATVLDTHGNAAEHKIKVTVKDPQYPTASIISPRNKQVFVHGDNITFTSTYSDFEDGATILNSSLIWNSSIIGVFGNGTSFIKPNISIGNHTIYFTVTDSDSMSSAASVNITVNPAPPIPSINLPKHGNIFGQTDYIIFNGTATDYEDGTLSSDSLNWTSNKNGFLGIGSTLNLTNLVAGTHLITLTANDSSGLKGATSLNIIVVGLGQILINKFADYSTIKNLNFTTLENKTAYVKIPKNANVTYAAINVRGLLS